MSNEDISKLVVQLVGKAMRLEARCDALVDTIAVLSSQVGVDPIKIDGSYRLAFRQRHHERLIELEKVSPSLAAFLDDRTELPPTELD